MAALHARARMFEQRVHLLVPRELADRELAREEHGLPGVVATPSEEASTAIRKARLVPPVRVSSLVARSGGGWLPDKMEDMAKLLVSGTEAEKHRVRTPCRVGSCLLYLGRVSDPILRHLEHSLGTLARH